LTSIRPALRAIMKYMSKPKSAAVKDVHIDVADILVQKYRYRSAKVILIQLYFTALCEGWPESPYRTRQMRSLLAKLPVDSLFVIEWLVTRRLIDRVRSRVFHCLRQCRQITTLTQFVCMTVSVITQKIVDSFLPRHVVHNVARQDRDRSEFKLETVLESTI